MLQVLVVWRLTVETTRELIRVYIMSFGPSIDYYECIQPHISSP